MGREPANPAKAAKQTRHEGQGLACLASLAISNGLKSENRALPDPELFEERAAIIEFDAGLSRRQAEDMAARAQGYDNVIAFRAAVNQCRRIADGP